MAELQESFQAKDFCHSGNFAAALSYLSQELTLLGLPAVLDGDGRPLQVALVNAAWHLLTRCRTKRAEEMELQSQLRAASVEKCALQATLSRHRDHCAALESQLSRAQDQLKQQVARISDLQTRLVHSKNEVRRLQGVAEQRAAHYHHDLRKQELQLEKLKDMVNRKLDKPAGERRAGITLSAQLGRPDGARARWKTPDLLARDREEAFRRVLEGVEARHLRAVETVDQYRGLLCAIVQRLIDASEQFPCDSGCSECGDAHMLATLELGLPHEFIAQPLQELVHCRLSRVQRATQRRDGEPVITEPDSPTSPTVPCTLVEDAVVTTSTETEGGLLHKLEAAERIIAEQRHIIEVATGEGACDGSFQRGAFFVEEREELEIRERQLREQRAALDRERHIYTEAVLRLGRERVELETEKAELLRTQFLASSAVLTSRSSSARPRSEFVSPSRVVSPKTPRRISARSSPQLWIPDSPDINGNTFKLQSGSASKVPQHAEVLDAADGLRTSLSPDKMQRSPSFRAGGGRRESPRRTEHVIGLSGEQLNPKSQQFITTGDCRPNGELPHSCVTNYNVEDAGQSQLLGASVPPTGIHMPDLMGDEASSVGHDENASKLPGITVEAAAACPPAESDIGLL